MTQASLKFITFGISHFCEKARWALDWHGVRYSEIGWAPGLHRIIAKRHRAPATTLPILFDGTDLIQGSGAIIDWAEKHCRDAARSLAPIDRDAAEAEEIERRTDEVIGPHVRRFIYAETLPTCPDVVKPALFLSTSVAHRVIGGLMWPATRKIMMSMYDVCPGAAAESQAKLEAELDWLDRRLADGRPYLVGDRLSRADIAVASLLAPLARPKEMPIYSPLDAIDAFTALAERWKERRTIGWINLLYAVHRGSTRRADAGSAV